MKIIMNLNDVEEFNEFKNMFNEPSDTHEFIINSNSDEEFNVTVNKR